MMYIIDMPLYVSSVLHLYESLPGHLMGLAAGIEIPVMLIAGFLVPTIGKRNLFFIAIICGLLFYIGMILCTSQFALFALWLILVLSIFKIYCRLEWALHQLYLITALFAVSF